MKTGIKPEHCSNKFPPVSACDLETSNPSVYLKTAAFKDEEKDAKAL